MKRVSKAGAICLLAITIIMPGFPALAAKAYYRWVDETGNTIMSDRPPPLGIEYETISADTGMSTNRAQPPGNTGPEEPARTNGGQEFEAVPQIEKSIPKDPALCEQATMNLDALQSARVRIKDENGEFRYIDEKEKQEQRKLARDAIEAYCE